jgi:hypothetical protein
MPEYHVSYSIDIEEESPLEAARWLATRLESYGYAGRGVYEVFPHDGGDGVQIDLSGEIEDQVLKPSPRIELLTVRDPDSSTGVTLFIDGVEATRYEGVDVDPGAGHEIQDWLESMVDIYLANYSAPFKELALASYEAYRDNQFIMGDAEDAVISCHHAEGRYPDKVKFCHWQHPFESVESAAAALEEHTRTAHPEK